MGCQASSPVKELKEVCFLDDFVRLCASEDYNGLLAKSKAIDRSSLSHSDRAKYARAILASNDALYMLAPEYHPDAAKAIRTIRSWMEKKLRSTGESEVADARAMIESKVFGAVAAHLPGMSESDQKAFEQELAKKPAAHLVGALVSLLESSGSLIVIAHTARPTWCHRQSVGRLDEDPRLSASPIFSPVQTA